MVALIFLAVIAVVFTAVVALEGGDPRSSGGRRAC